MLINKDIVINVDCPKDLVVETYPGAWYQVVSNLIQNSIKHGFEGRESGRIWIHVKLSDSKLVVVYQDDGVGVSEEVHSKVFEPFVTTKRNQGGSGLGMHIVYNLVTQILNGEIASPKLDKQGAMFEIVCFVHQVKE